MQKEQGHPPNPFWLSFYCCLQALVLQYPSWNLDEELALSLDWGVIWGNFGDCKNLSFGNKIFIHINVVYLFKLHLSLVYSTLYKVRMKYHRTPVRPGVQLCSPLSSGPQERHGPVRAGPEEATKNDQKAGTPLLWGRSERAGAVQPGEEKAPGRPLSSLPVPEGAYKKAGEGLFTRACGDRTRENGFRLKEGRCRFRLHIRKKFFTVRVVRRWHRLPREAVAASVPGSVQSQAGWSFEQPGPEESVPACGSGSWN